MIIHVWLVRQTKDQNLAAFDGLGPLIQRFCDSMHHMFRHPGINLAGEFNEARILIELACFPSEIEGIDWDTVSAKPRPWIERHKSKRLRLCCINYLPDIDAHRLINELE